MRQSWKTTEIKNCKIKLKEIKRGKQNKTKQIKAKGEDQRTKMKVVEDGRLLCKFLHCKFKPFLLLFLYNTYVLWIHIVTKATYFSVIFMWDVRIRIRSHSTCVRNRGLPLERTMVHYRFNTEIFSVNSQ